MSEEFNCMEDVQNTEEIEYVEETENVIEPLDLNKLAKESEEFVLG